MKIKFKVDDWFIKWINKFKNSKTVKRKQKQFDDVSTSDMAFIGVVFIIIAVMFRVGTIIQSELMSMSNTLNQTLETTSKLINLLPITIFISMILIVIIGVRALKIGNNDEDNKNYYLNNEEK